tara:strand:+ start:46 stop:348 length:303 start_codon:yes stop_codon:yes gene_type:complete
MPRQTVKFKLSDNSTISAPELAKKIGTTREAARHRLNRTNDITKLFLKKNEWWGIGLEGPPAVKIKVEPKKIKVEPKKPRKKKVYIDQSKLTMAHLMNNI